MAIKIPTYDSSVQANRGMTAPRNLPTPIDPTKPTAQQFGVDKEAAKANIGRGVSNLGNAATNIAIKIQDADNKQKVTDGTNEYLSYLNDLNHNEKSGLLNKTLNNAKNIIGDYDAATAKYRQELLKKMDNNAQRAVLNNQMESYTISNRSAVQRHAVNEDRKSKDITMKTNVKLNIDNARTITDPASLGVAIATAASTYKVNMDAMGIPGETQEVEIKNLAGKMVESSVDSLLAEGDIKGARAYLQDTGLLSKLSEDDKATINAKIKGKELFNIKDKIVGIAKNNLMYLDGSIDMAKARELVDAEPGLTVDEKEKLWNEVKSDISEVETNVKENRSSSRYGWMEYVAKSKKAGVPLSDILTHASEYAWDNSSERELIQLAKEKYLNQKDYEDPSVYLDLRQKAQNGSITQQQIYDHWMNGDITGAHYVGLVESLNKGTTTDQARIDQDVEELVNAKYRKANKVLVVNGVKRNARDAVKMLILDDTRGLTYDQTIEYTKNTLKDKVPVSVDGVYENMSIKGALEVRSDNLTKIAEARESLGGMFESFPGTDMEKMNFINENGGIGAFSYGTPRYNAVQALLKQGIKPTSEYINKILTLYPSGVVPDNKSFKVR